MVRLGTFIAAGRLPRLLHWPVLSRESTNFTAELQRYGFDFDRLSNEIASRDAGLPTSELVANLRSGTMQHWAPPGGGYHGALNHVVIHGLDVTVPLGVPRLSPDETIRIVLNDLTRGDTDFGISFEGRSLQATDLDWSHGSGSPLRGAAADLALVLCGRTLPRSPCPTAAGPPWRDRCGQASRRGAVAAVTWRAGA